MLLFRSEEHLERWLTERDLRRGATLTPAQQWQLGRSWYSDRMDPAQRRTPDQAEEIFTGLGLTGDFWTLVPPGS